MTRLYLITFFVGIFFSTFAQKQILLHGVVKDSLSQPIIFANVIATLPDNSKPLRFAMTNEKGSFAIKLQINKKYRIEVTSLGYIPYKFTVDTNKKLVFQNIILKEQNELLQQVVINAKQPIVLINKDSITYKTDKFINGKERKLKDVLKKLPGVQVNSNGNITVMGKKVSKVFVNGKAFFGGNTKLAINSIPADVINDIVAVKDYNSIGFMKGLNQNKELIINIKLKAGKERFVFGDITGGAGNQKKIIAKANLFYYSPKTNLMYVGNYNNVGEIPINFTDFTRVNQDDNSTTALQQDYNEVVQLIYNKDFINQINNFHSFEWQQDFGKKITFDVYGILSDNIIEEKKEDYQYSYQNEIEKYYKKEQKNNRKLKYATAHLKYKISNKQYFDYHLNINKNTSNNIENILLNSNSVNTSIYNIFQKEKYTINNRFDWYKKWNKHHILRFLSSFSTSNDIPVNMWSTNQAIFSNILPVNSDNNYKIKQEVQTNFNKINFELKEFWKINGRNHIYTSIGGTIQHQKFYTNTFQIMESNAINPFDNSDFNNDLALDYKNVYFALQYRFKLNNIMITPGLYAHYLNWNFTNDFSKYKTGYLLLPKINITSKINHKSSIKINYELNTNILPISNYGIHYYLTDINELKKGNSFISNDLFHKLDIDYNYFKLSKGITAFVFFQFLKKEESLQQRIDQTGINTIINLSVKDAPKTSLSNMFFIRKDFRNTFVEFNNVLSYYDSNLIINDIETQSQLFSQYYSLSLGLKSKKLNDFKIGLNYQKTATIKPQIIAFQSISPTVEFDLPYKSFQFMGAYSYRLNYSKNISNIHNGRLSVIYHKEGSAMSISAGISNIFNSKIHENNTFYTYFYTTHIDYKQPVIFLISLTYHL